MPATCTWRVIATIGWFPGATGKRWAVILLTPSDTLKLYVVKDDITSQKRMMGTLYPGLEVIMELS